MITKNILCLNKRISDSGKKETFCNPANWVLRYRVIMPDQSDHSATGSPASEYAQEGCNPADVQFLAEISTGMCLERIVEITEEFDHLNNLIMLHIENSGGFTST